MLSGQRQSAIAAAGCAACRCQLCHSPGDRALRSTCAALIVIGIAVRAECRYVPPVCADIPAPAWLSCAKGFREWYAETTAAGVGFLVRVSASATAFRPVAAVVAFYRCSRLQASRYGRALVYGRRPLRDPGLSDRADASAARSKTLSTISDGLPLPARPLGWATSCRWPSRSTVPRRRCRRWCQGLTSFTARTPPSSGWSVD